MRPEGPKIEAKGRERGGVGEGDEGSKPPAHSLGGLGSAVCSPSGVPGGGTLQRFYTILSTQYGLR